VYRSQLWDLIMAGWKPLKPMLVMNWCLHDQQFIPCLEADGLWVLVPIVEAVANRLRADEPTEDAGRLDSTL
jgi:hypothetical protein